MIFKHRTGNKPSRYARAWFLDPVSPVNLRLVKYQLIQSLYHLETIHERFIRNIRTLIYCSYCAFLFLHFFFSFFFFVRLMIMTKMGFSYKIETWPQATSPIVLRFRQPGNLSYDPGLCIGVYYTLWLSRIIHETPCQCLTTFPE